MPLVGAAALHGVEWFYPAMMIVVGAHCLPFAFLYGMRAFIELSSVLVSSGLLVGMYAPERGLWAKWLTSGALLAFAFVGRAVAERGAKAKGRTGKLPTA